MTLNSVTFDVPGRRPSRSSLLFCPRTGETFRAVEIRRSLLWDNDAAKFRNGLQVVREARRERYALMLIDYYFFRPQPTVGPYTRKVRRGLFPVLLSTETYTEKAQGALPL